MTGRTKAAAALAEAARFFKEHGDHGMSCFRHADGCCCGRASIIDTLAAYDAAPADDGWRPIETAPVVPLATLAIALLLFFALRAPAEPRPLDWPWCSTDRVAWPARLTDGGGSYCHTDDIPTAADRWWNGPYCPTSVVIGDALRLAGCAP